MKVVQLSNAIFTSNTYCISSAKSNKVWLIDIVDAPQLIEALSPEQVVEGVFITHAHYDHIYGINELTGKFPDCKVYVSDYGKYGLYCDKTNLSFYHEDPVVFRGTNLQVVKDGDIITLWESCLLEVIHTPGHNPGSLTFKVGQYLFTGDSYIPGVKVVTKLKGGNRKENEASLAKIHSLIQEDTVICPGHGKYGRLSDFNE